VSSERVNELERKVWKNILGFFFFCFWLPMLYVAYGCIYYTEVFKSQINTKTIFFFKFKFIQNLKNQKN